MYFRSAIVFVLFMLLSLPGQAEIYKFVDENGVVHYTDNPDLVPLDQLPKTEITPEKDDFLTAEEKAEKRRREKAADRQAKLAASASKKQQNYDEEMAQVQDRLKEFKELKLRLDIEHNHILKEQKALDVMKTTITTQEQRNDFNQKVAVLNKRILAYEAKRKDYNEEYNQVRRELNKLERQRLEKEYDASIDQEEAEKEAALRKKMEMQVNEEYERDRQKAELESQQNQQ
jgi:hypothetical protein